VWNFGFGQGDRKLSVGVHGGPAGATMYGDEESRKIHNIKFKPVFSFIAGINMQYVVKPKFWFHIELNYERKGYEENWPVSDQNLVVIGTGVQKNYYDYITLPIMGKFILNKKK